MGFLSGGPLPPSIPDEVGAKSEFTFESAQVHIQSQSLKWGPHCSDCRACPVPRTELMPPMTTMGTLCFSKLVPKLSLSCPEKLRV